MWDEEVWQKLGRDIVLFLPRLGTGVVVFLVFWLLARGLQRVVERLTRVQRFDPALTRYLGSAARIVHAWDALENGAFDDVLALTRNLAVEYATANEIREEAFMLARPRTRWASMRSSSSASSASSLAKERTTRTAGIRSLSRA